MYEHFFIPNCTRTSLDYLIIINMQFNFIFLHSNLNFALFKISWHALGQSACWNFCMYFTCWRIVRLLRHRPHYLRWISLRWLTYIVNSVDKTKLFRFQTRTELFCSVYKKICVHTYRFRLSALQRGSREKPHGSVCPPFWIPTVEWSGSQSRPFDDATVFR